jgi:hypothetical protein
VKSRIYILKRRGKKGVEDIPEHEREEQRKKGMLMFLHKMKKRKKKKKGGLSVVK